MAQVTGIYTDFSIIIQTYHYSLKISLNKNEIRLFQICPQDGRFKVFYEFIQPVNKYSSLKEFSLSLYSRSCILFF